MTTTDKVTSFLGGCCLGYFLAHIVWAIVR